MAENTWVSSVEAENTLVSYVESLKYLSKLCWRSGRREVGAVDRPAAGETRTAQPAHLPRHSQIHLVSSFRTKRKTQKNKIQCIWLWRRRAYAVGCLAEKGPKVQLWFGGEEGGTLPPRPPHITSLDKLRRIKVTTRLETQN